ncbi:hypothetical protein COM05_18860 [Bacillus toyonensis]|uniref:site-specific integrase n=1 Tax=Bacillus toyonensis TaxID=155322 RepID=UPI000BF7869D|nr:site-specific integrase [Bacillus toyonensis]PGB81754.1 hypothetical protein COM05_18860 [Bacillus toyonensis]
MKVIHQFYYNELNDNHDVMEEYSGDEFDLLDAVDAAKETIERLVTENVWLVGEFEDDEWVLEDDKESFATVTFQFMDVSNDILKMQLKCWAVLLLEERRPITVRLHVANVVRFMRETDNFSDEKIVHIEDVILTVPENVRSYALSSSVNFLDYISNNLYEEFLNELRAVKRKYPTLSPVRELPPYLDVLRFSYLISEAAVKWNTEQRIKFLPVLIWWKLTTIIPMRISEFVTIKRNCLSVNEKKELFITLPRRKQKATTKKLSVPDTLPISEEVYRLIEEYIELTSPYGKTETMISYRTYREMNRKNVMRRTLNVNRFTSSLFRKILNEFYEYFVFDKKGLPVISKSEWAELREYETEVEEFGFSSVPSYIVRIQPNDTRHFAICNMMLQGMNPLTIARMAGHSHIKTQYSYQCHIEYFIDSKVYELALLNKMKNGIGFEEGDFASSLALKDNLLNSLKSYEEHKFGEDDEVEIGYCTDDSKRCESSVCALCSKNWIPRREIEANLKELIELRTQIRKKLKIATKTLMRIHDEMTVEYKTERVDPTEDTDLKRKAKEVNGAIHDYSMILAKLGIGVAG